MDYPVSLVSQLRQLLRSLRKARGWTQADLAQRLGVVQSRVATIERDPGAVSVEQLLHILALLGAQFVVRDGQPAGASLEAHIVARPRTSATLTTGADVPPPPAAPPSKGQW